MPKNNHFRHQTYQSEHLTSAPQLFQATPTVRVESAEGQEQLAGTGRALGQAGVAAIYLVHGTFIGNDPVGLLCSMAAIWPSTADTLRRLQKRVFDKTMGDIGNYSPEYARTLEQGINRDLPVEQQISVHLFHWSSENHHLGRADGAVKLIDELVRADYRSGKRVLILGHSHGGNVMAIASNLLAGNRETRESFFHAARTYYRSTFGTDIALPEWRRVRECLDAPNNPLAHLCLDMVTFGTPVRYGWDSDGYSRLLHFINHRPHEEMEPTLAHFPPSVADIQSAEHGDIVQWMGIAGTNFPPAIITFGTWLADHRLHQLLQHGVRRRDALSAVRRGFRLPNEGETLMVDYGPSNDYIWQHLAGHAVYTKTEWMLFHLEQISRRWYGG